MKKPELYCQPFASKRAGKIVLELNVTLTQITLTLLLNTCVSKNGHGIATRS